MPAFCNSFWPGHTPGGRTAHKSVESAKRIPVTLKYLGGTEFRATIIAQELSTTFHNHDPIRLTGLIELAPRCFFYVEGSNYLNLILNGSYELISMSPTPLSTCSLGRWAPKRSETKPTINFTPIS